jgi:hypothetical protein
MGRRPREFDRDPIGGYHGRRQPCVMQLQLGLGDAELIAGR